MSGADLHAEMRAAAEASTLLHFRHLEALGIPVVTVADRRRDHWGWGVASVIDAGDGLYQPDDGPLHLVLPVHEDGELVDLVAFRSKDPTRWLLRTGLGWALGLERGLERLTWQESVCLSVSPLEWLRHGAEGVCILDWTAPEIKQLRDLPRIECSDARLAARLKAALTRTPQLPEISLVRRRRAA